MVQSITPFRRSRAMAMFRAPCPQSRALWDVAKLSHWQQADTNPVEAFEKGNLNSEPSSAAAGMPHAAKIPPAAVKPCVPSIVMVPRPKK